MDLLFQKLFGVLSMCKNDMPPTDYNSYLYDLTEAHFSVFQMQTHLIRNYIQESFWQSLVDEVMNEEKPTTALLTAGCKSYPFIFFFEINHKSAVEY